MYMGDMQTASAWRSITEASHTSGRPRLSTGFFVTVMVSPAVLVEFFLDVVCVEVCELIDDVEAVGS